MHMTYCADKQIQIELNNLKILNNKFDSIDDSLTDKESTDFKEEIDQFYKLKIYKNKLN